VNDVIVVAPADARWSDRAESVLSAVGLFVARLYEPGLLPLLLRSRGVRLVAIDIRIRLRGGAVLRECTVIAPTVRIVLVHEGQPAITVGNWRSQAWPDSSDAMLALLGAPWTPDAA
jgi:hypothetical protein